MSTTYCSEITIKFNLKSVWIKKLSADDKVIPLNDDGTYTYTVGDIITRHEQKRVIHNITYTKDRWGVHISLVTYRKNWKKETSPWFGWGFFQMGENPTDAWKLILYKQGVNFEDTPEAETW